MRFGLDRMRRLMTVLDSPEAALPNDPRGRHQRQVLDHAHDRRDPRAPRAAHRLLPLAAPGLLHRAHPGRRARHRRRRVRRRDRSAPRGGRARQPHARRGRSRDPVRAAHRRGPVGARRASEVEVGVVEAGLGGRYDATNVLDATVAVLTNVGLEHTRWLGPTIADIATEKLAVLQPAPRWSREQPTAGSARLAHKLAEELGAEFAVAEDAPPGCDCARAGPFSAPTSRLRAWPPSHTCERWASLSANKPCATPRARQSSPDACRWWRATR